MISVVTVLVYRLCETVERPAIQGSERPLYNGLE